MRIISYLSIGMIFFGLLACTETKEPSPYTYSQIFTGKVSKSWKLDRLLLRESGKTDVVYSLNNCERDDLYVFYANTEKKLEVQNGSNKCDSEEDNLLVTYKWEFNQASASLSMVLPHIFGYYFIPFTVKEAKSDKMTLEIFIDEAATISYVMEFKRASEE